MMCLKARNPQVIPTLTTNRLNEIPVKNNAKTNLDHENEDRQVRTPITTDDRKIAEVHRVPMIAGVN